MSNVLSAVVIGGCLVGAIWTVGLASRNRRATNALLIELGLTELLLIVQFAVAVIAVAAGDRPDETATFISYALTVVLLLPVGVFWSQAERSRSSTLVIAVACLGAAVMTARMLQLWGSVGG